MITNETNVIYIPTNLIKQANEHPEEYGDYILILHNNMCTDAYYDEEKQLFFTISNDDELIGYIENKKGEIQMENRKYVEIHSSININVTTGLQALDMTDAKAGVADKLKVQPLWAKQLVRLAPGQYYYPAEIVNWNTVKALAKDKVITIGKEVNALPNDLSEEVLAFVNSNFETLEIGKVEVERQIESQQTHEGQTKTVTIADINFD